MANIIKKTDKIVKPWKYVGTPTKPKKYKIKPGQKLT